MKKYLDFAVGTFIFSIGSIGLSLAFDFFSALVMVWIAFVKNGFSIPHC